MCTHCRCLCDSQCGSTSTHTLPGNQCNGYRHRKLTVCSECSIKKDTFGVSTETSSPRSMTLRETLQQLTAIASPESMDGLPFAWIPMGAPLPPTAEVFKLVTAAGVHHPAVQTTPSEPSHSALLVVANGGVVASPTTIPTPQGMVIGAGNLAFVPIAFPHTPLVCNDRAPSAPRWYPFRDPY